VFLVSKQFTEEKMMKNKTNLFKMVGFLLVLGLLFAVMPAGEVEAAGPWYVRTDGSDTTCDGLADVAAGSGGSCAFATIAKAVSSASSGDTIYVGAGTYSAGANLNKSVTLLGAQAGVDARDGRIGASETIISAGGAGTFSLNATNITFDGFKFTNMSGRTLDTYFDAHYFTMRNCILEGNIGTYQGGAIQFGGGTDKIADYLLFENNLVTADNGYLLYLGHAMDYGMIRNNLFNGDSVSFGPFGNRVGWLIEGNEFDGNVDGHGPYWGFGFNGSFGDVVIRNNYVHEMAVGIGQLSINGGEITGNSFFDNSYAAFQLWGGEWDSVVSSGVLIQNNWFKYNGTTYTDYADAAHGFRIRPTPDSSTIQVLNNRFENLGVGAPGDVWAIRQGGSGILDAEQNYWGTTDKAVIETMYGEGDVDYSPLIGSYTDDPTPPYPNGFWPENVVTFEVCSTDCYVSPTGSDSNPGTETYPLLTVQKGIDYVQTGGTVHVAAGTYAEDITIDKALDLLGPNAAINPNTGTRVPEAIIVPATSDPDPYSSGSMSVIYVEVDDVTIKGFTIDGDNPALSSGHVVGSADIDSIEGIGGYEGVGQIVVENNILQNFTYTGIEFYNYVDSSATSENYIRYNQFQNIGDTIYNWGIGILVYNNFYADITDNVFDIVRTGIQTGNFHRANVGSTGKISNNELNVWRLGIFHNLWYSDASTITIENNTINAIAYPGATKWNGVLLTSFGSDVDAIIKNNIITVPGTVTYEDPGYSAGYNIWNDTTTATLTIEGGSVTGADYGVFVNNYEGYTSDGGDTAITIDGVVIDALEIGVYVLDSPLNTNGSTVTATLVNNTISSDDTGVKVEGDTATATGDHNKINGSTTDIESSALVTLDFEENYWGSPCGPVVIGSVDYIPWFADEAMTLPRTENVSGTFDLLMSMGTPEKNAIIECAAPGTVFTFETGPHAGDIVVNNDDLTFELNGATVGAGSPAFTINGDDIKILGPGVIDGAGSSDSGILVNGGADNFILEGVYVANWADGIEVNGAHESFKVVSSWIHDNTYAGLLFETDVTLSGVITIEGNLFKDNGAYGIENLSTATIQATYNSWGHIDGPTAGDPVYGLALADYTPFTYSEVFVDMEPDTLATSFDLNEQATFDVAVKVDAVNLYAVIYKLTYDPTMLEFVSLTQGTNFDPGANAFCLTNTATAGEITVDCSKFTGAEVSNPNGETISTITFKATGTGLTGNGPWTTTLDLSDDEADLSSGATGGVKVFVNNGGFGAPSGEPGHTITDTDDGTVNITGLANFTGYIDLQGRANDSGAFLTVYDQQAISGATALAEAISASSGKYTTAYLSAYQLTIGSTYYFQADADLYLPTTQLKVTPGDPDLPADYVNSDVLDTRSLTTLLTFELLGGDATNDDAIDIADLGLIGFNYNSAVGAYTGGSSPDVNGDGVVDIYDLVLAGGNYYKAASPWDQTAY
jgi:hypothetical protein